eukprot:TRINITY_DN2613_c1_g1_i1.p2 TRINITY_DN2613_c1_g1~~TRINITY_DN2613_c1_g1_i1.p2  ORF type:complete len:212 (-),score=-0.10 TRINITY_DN2613_c1_g1_i1:122-757(-)
MKFSLYIQKGIIIRFFRAGSVGFGQVKGEIRSIFVVSNCVVLQSLDKTFALKTQKIQIVPYYFKKNLNFIIKLTLICNQLFTKKIIILRLKNVDGGEHALNLANLFAEYYFRVIEASKNNLFVQYIEFFINRDSLNRVSTLKSYNDLCINLFVIAFQNTGSSFLFCKYRKLEILKWWQIYQLQRMQMRVSLLAGSQSNDLLFKQVETGVWI